MSSLALAIESARRLARECSAELEGLEEEAAARRALALLAAEGLLSWTVPQRDGGAAVPGVDADRVGVGALCELRSSLAWGSGMLDVMLVMQGLGSYPVARGGSESLRARVLPGVLDGTRIAAFALTEPDAGSSLGEVATEAARNGDGWSLTGRKTFISNAGIANFYSVLARTSGEPGDGGRDSLTMFWVPAESPGLAVRPFEVMAPHPIGDVEFQDVEVPDASRLGEVGAGLSLALGTLAQFRTSVAAAANGFARRALDESLGRLSSRSQFGKPLAANQGLKFDLAEMDVRLRAAELLVEEAAREVDRGRDAVAEVARAKLYATETASYICDRAVQHHGGLGVRRGSVVERLFREVRALRIYEGTSEIQRLILAKSILDGSRGG